MDNIIIFDMVKVSVLLLTIDRLDLMKQWTGDALDNAGYPFDLCVTDNGSTDLKVIDWVKQRNPKIFNINTENKGTAQSLNRMIRQNPSDLWVFIGNDMEYPKNWLKKMVDTITKVDKSGVVGINWRPLNYETKNINGVKIWPTDKTFGCMMITKELRRVIGNFCEDYGTYGLWDSDYSIRAEIAGYINYYIADEISVHRGNDTDTLTEYRKMKNKSLTAAQPKFIENVKRYNETKLVYL